MKVQAIFGPPGTGKTRTLVEIAREEQALNQPGLYLSYTKAAAEEAVSRLEGSRIKPSTLHSLAFRCLDMSRASVVDHVKMAQFAAVTGIPFKGSERGSDEPQEGDEYANVLEYAGNRIIHPIDAYDLFGRPGTVARFERFVKEYESWKSTYGYMDFNDMLSVFQQVRRLNMAAEFVILDEAQDCTPLQWLAFIRVCSAAKRVYIAGDDDQAIYEWSGANPHGMVEFTESHEGKVRVLEQSYRVPGRVYALAHDALLNRINNRLTKKFRPTLDYGEVNRRGDFWDVDLNKLYEEGGAMVLVRDQFRLAEVMKEFNRQMIPYDALGRASPWTSRLAASLRKGEKPEIPLWWRDFYSQADLSQPTDRVVLSTIHQAKGREADRVVVDLAVTPRVERGWDTNPDAELRVWYVAVTRARKELTLCGGNMVL